VLLAIFGFLSSHMKDCTLFYMGCNASSHPGIMLEWYQISEKYMILATITLFIKDEESLLSLIELFVNSCLPLYYGLEG
jgi:hypothetical protein